MMTFSAIRGAQIIDVTKDCKFQWFQEPKSCYAFLEVSGASGDFSDGETVTGGTSGATATVFSSYVGGGRVYIENVSGTFQAGETITGSSSNQTATVNGFVAKRSWPDNIIHGTFPDSIISKDTDDYLEWESTLIGAGHDMVLHIEFPTSGLYFCPFIGGVGERVNSTHALRDCKGVCTPGRQRTGTTGEYIGRAFSGVYNTIFHFYNGYNPLNYIVKDDVGLSVIRYSFYQNNKGTFRWRIHNIRVLKLII